MKKLFFLIILLPVSFLLLLIACKPQAESNTIQIMTGDFYFKPGIIKLKAGQKVNIELVNEGNIEHEFMVGRVVKMVGDKAHEKPGEAGEEGHETSVAGHEHNEGTHSAHAGTSRGFDKDFFEGIEVATETENGAEFMRMPGHGTMVLLKPRSKAIITFTVPTDRIGEWEMACFIPGHYEAKMKGEIIVE